MTRIIRKIVPHLPKGQFGNRAIYEGTYSESDVFKDNFFDEEYNNIEEAFEKDDELNTEDDNSDDE